MAIFRYKLTYNQPHLARESDAGLTVARRVVMGEEEGNELVFRDEDEELILRITVVRASEICEWSAHEQWKRINARLERLEYHRGSDYREHGVSPPLTCKHCHVIITEIDKDFTLHPIPWCKGWRADQSL